MIEPQKDLSFKTYGEIELVQLICDIDNKPTVSIRVNNHEIGIIDGVLSVTDAFGYVYDSKDKLIAVF
jgi:hypothetical protein